MRYAILQDLSYSSLTVLDKRVGHLILILGRDISLALVGTTDVMEVKVLRRALLSDNGREHLTTCLFVGLLCLLHLYIISWTD